MGLSPLEASKARLHALIAELEDLRAQPPPVYQDDMMDEFSPSAHARPPPPPPRNILPPPGTKVSTKSRLLLSRTQRVREKKPFLARMMHDVSSSSPSLHRRRESHHRRGEGDGHRRGEGNGHRCGREKSQRMIRPTMAVREELAAADARLRGEEDKAKRLRESDAETRAVREEAERRARSQTVALMTRMANAAKQHALQEKEKAEEHALALARKREAERMAAEGRRRRKRAAGLRRERILAQRARDEAERQARIQAARQTQAAEIQAARRAADEAAARRHARLSALERQRDRRARMLVEEQMAFMEARTSGRVMRMAVIAERRAADEAARKALLAERAEARQAREDEEWEKHLRRERIEASIAEKRDEIGLPVTGTRFVEFLIQEAELEHPAVGVGLDITPVPPQSPRPTSSRQRSFRPPTTPQPIVAPSSK